MTRIVLWKLSNSEKIDVTQKAVNKLKLTIKDAIEKGNDRMDIVWGPGLSVEVIDVENVTIHVVDNITSVEELKKVLEIIQ